MKNLHAKYLTVNTPFTFQNISNEEKIKRQHSMNHIASLSKYSINYGKPYTKNNHKS